MHGPQGEFEFLIGRNQRFRIIGAEYFPHKDLEDPVLKLVLEPM
jgi:hypothetical protein